MSLLLYSQLYNHCRSILSHEVRHSLFFTQGGNEQEAARPFRYDEELMELEERLSSLNSVDDPHVSQEGVRLLEVGRSRGIKDLRVYNAVFQVRGPRNKLPHSVPTYVPTYLRERFSVGLR